MAFTRTKGGLVEKWRFYAEPTVWVEGPTDIYFYEPLFRGTCCRIEAMYGANNADALVQGLVKYNYPYLVLLDGDYRILKRARKVHPNAFTLPCYSFENFLWEREVVNRVCLRHAQCGERKDIVGVEMERMEKQLKQRLTYAVAVDIAARRSSSSPSVLPDRVEQILLDHRRPDVSQVKVSKFVAIARRQLGLAQIRRAQADVMRFANRRSFMSILKGHFVLGVLRRIFNLAVEKERGRKAILGNDVIVEMLSEALWRRASNDEHRRFRSTLRSYVRRLNRQFPPLGSN